MGLEEISHASELMSDALRKRTERAPPVEIAHWYRFTIDRQEATLVVLDLWPNDPTVILYELFVDPLLKGIGIGTQALAAVEDFTRQIGRSQVKLRPFPFDKSISEDDLKRWYMAQGYVPEGGDSHLYYKIVAQ